MDRLKDLTEENTNLYNKITKLNNDVLYRKSILAQWSEIPPELRDAVEAAYNDSVSKAEMIKDALNEITNLKSVINYINETAKSNHTSNDQQLHLNNINNLVLDYSSMNMAFLAKHGNLLHADFTL